MDNLKKLSQGFTLSLPTDDEGFTGRECPNSVCKGYFKIEHGTGLKGSNLPCHCPYCGHTTSHSEFTTPAQKKYIDSVVQKNVGEALREDLKQLEFEMKPKGFLGIGVSLKLQNGKPIPIQHYREPQLETIIICDSCTLRYAIYGVFGYCPDCGIHNSLQIFTKSLELIKKQITLAVNVDAELSKQLKEDALENVVSAFDGFGREICRVNAAKSIDPGAAQTISFQSIMTTRKRVRELFAYDLASNLSTSDWDLVCRCFQKRHLLAHKMGVIDDHYVTATKDSSAIVGRNISIQADEVEALAKQLEIIANEMSTHIK